MESFILWWAEHVMLSPRLSVFLISMIPLIEERGGLILARLLMPNEMWAAVFWCMLGNIVPIPFILFGIKKVLYWMSKHNLSKVANWLIHKAEKNEHRIVKYGFWGLMLFVGIPLPGTGAWTGSLVAAVFNMDVKRASVSIFLGIILAAIIMTTLSYGIFG